MIRLQQVAWTCREAVELMNDYLGDAMKTVERAHFEQHLHACPWCLTYLGQLEETITKTNALAAAESSDKPDTQLPPAFEDSIRQLYRKRLGPR